LFNIALFCTPSDPQDAAKTPGPISSHAPSVSLEHASKRAVERYSIDDDIHRKCVKHPSSNGDFIQNTTNDDVPERSSPPQHSYTDNIKHEVESSVHRLDHDMQVRPAGRGVY
jgi:hypothetical protein